MKCRLSVRENQIFVREKSGKCQGISIPLERGNPENIYHFLSFKFVFFRSEGVSLVLECQTSNLEVLANSTSCQLLVKDMQ